MHQNIHGPQNFTPLILSINLSPLKKVENQWSTLQFVKKVRNLDSTVFVAQWNKSASLIFFKK